METCIRCEEMKPLDLFTKDRRNKNGHTKTCKACRALKRRKPPSQQVFTAPAAYAYQIVSLFGYELALHNVFVKIEVEKGEPTRVLIPVAEPSLQDCYQKWLLTLPKK